MVGIKLILTYFFLFLLSIAILIVCRWCDKDGECVLFEVMCDGYCGVKS